MLTIYEAFICTSLPKYLLCVRQDFKFRDMSENTGLYPFPRLHFFHRILFISDKVQEEVS